ncbi:5,10-methylene tetrahydromethanopterin reductase [Solibacillus sp. MA9]|uniref:5,10-methylene tetrahydromethanopterin reductase n=1 Tax=Solibacillus palustris TaxID=2908203 RepID=A0ABS9UDQ7_9BACL|nr:5,10-methylene tetrahydromethanopterin reductase [Solibacillus sp. MA9]MCH7322393.1 5,10-methylene tetrahydromethanopterin reductase [Solibacillus sp. MA9]
MKKWTIITIFVLLFSILPISPVVQHTEAASTQYVQAINDILLRDAPKQTANTILNIKSNSKVIVHSKNKNWAFVEYNGKKGYILASTLTTKKPKAIAKSPIITTGLMPKVNRSYTYEPSFEGLEKTTYYASKNEAISNSIELLQSDYIGFTYIEKFNELTFGVAYSDVFFFTLSYPIKEKATLLDTDYGYDGSMTTTKVFVESTSATLLTKAGTFNNVVILAYPNGTKLYFAKDYGIIRITDFEDKIVTELVSVD